ncbi:cytochrome c biogenesis CcdA family protein [Thermodesulfobacteriota bacterium]
MDEILIGVTNWLRAGPALAMPAAFLWGMVSVLLSPCHMASIPLLIAYVAGQHRILPPRVAAGYAVLFATGLFLTIVIIGTVCALLGRMRGDVGPYWQVGVGLLLVWVGYTFLQPSVCSATGGVIQRFQVKGLFGAFILGLAYGFLSGVCTFGFIAPILGIITLQDAIVYGFFMLVLFGAGHCLPLVAAGIFSARVMEVMDNLAWQKGVLIMRKSAGVVIVGLGCYFIAIPFM